MRILCIANDVVPGMGVPVAAPGLRAWSLAEGLKAHGHDTTLVVHRRIADKVWRADAPIPMSSGVQVASWDHLDGMVRSSKPDAVIFTNSNPVDHLSRVEGTLMVYDFFAPKMLERAYEARDEYPLERLQKLRDQKIRGFSLADLVVVNGAKKLPYVYAWLLQCDRDVRQVPVEVLPMGVPPAAPSRPADRLRLCLSGYLQPWSRPGTWMDGLVAALDSSHIDMRVLVADHWGGRERPELLDSYAGLMDHGKVSLHAPMPYGEYFEFLNSADVAIDLFAWNLEREYAMVTRSLVALCAGTAVVHPPFTEVSPLIEAYDAGWLVSPDDPESLRKLIRELASDPDQVERKRQNAYRLGREMLAPAKAVEPLLARLGELPG